MEVSDGEARPTGLDFPSRVVAWFRQDLPLVFLDVAIVFGAYLIPLVLRFDGAVPDLYWSNFIEFLPLILLFHLTANFVMRLYGPVWKYASIQEARRVVVAGIASGLLVIAAAIWLGEGLRRLPLSVMLFGAVLSLLGFGALRFQSRLFGFKRRVVVSNQVRTLVVGAGEAGAAILRDILRHDGLGIEPVGFVDDDHRKIGRSIHGVPVLGKRSMLPSLVGKYDIDQVLLAIPSARSEVVREVASLCEEADIPMRTLPSVEEIMGGRVTVRDIRDLQIEDLLGRQQVETDLESVRALLEGKRVLVTGAGGSIGSEICRQVADYSPAKLVLVDHDETHLHDAMVGLGGAIVTHSILADVRDRDGMFSLFMEHRPEIVFHAAAHKHVPVLESFPEEALRTNIIGTANVADAAVATGVSRFVFISTDKAVRPANVMGASKWFAEQIVRGVGGSDRIFCSVRFGNVLGSRGSVIPTFLRQIQEGDVVTVTDPSMTRYFMSLREAVQLVLQAAALSEGGEMFTLDMGEPVNIMGLAKKLIRLSGRVPDIDVPITVVGPRPGEKLTEEILNPDEESLPSGHAGISVSRPPAPSRAAVKRAIWDLEALAASGKTTDLAERIRSIPQTSLEPAGMADAS